MCVSIRASLVEWNEMQSISNIKRLKSGFTIVELLVVVVVIAILASITVVSYNGITERSKTARLASAVRDYANILSMYKVTYGQFPNIYGDPACLGANFPIASPYGVSECEMYGPTPLASTTVSTYDMLIPELKKVTNSLPDTSYPSLRVDQLAGSARYSRGAVYYNDSNEIYYYVKGNTKCPIGNSYYQSVSSTTQCVVSLE